MNTKNFRLTKLACYTAYYTMSSVFSLPPLLFATLQNMYGISYTLLGTLVLVNFCTQLAVDLILTAFSKYFNVKKIVTVMPLITSLGLFIYAVIPTILPRYAYAGLLTGTVLFSLSAGLSEVLLSPVIAAIPSEHPQKDMSMLHSLYAFGVFTVVVISTVFLKTFGHENWMYLTIFWALLPVTASVMFAKSAIPDMRISESSKTATKAVRKTLALGLCAGCIFFGSCAENAMSNWISSYMEKALRIDKTVGDILGMAVFAILLGAVRISYAKYGKHIMRILFVGMTGATACYLVAGLSSNIIFAFTACILTGLFTAMLWPGTLIMMEENLPGAGVAAYALMAASGDLGASIAPQLLGIVVDQVSAGSFARSLAKNLHLTTEQVGLKAGMLVMAIFPLIGMLFVLSAIHYFRSRKQKPI